MTVFVQTARARSVPREHHHLSSASCPFLKDACVWDASHRYPSSHACTGSNAPPPVSKNDKAKALLAKNFPGTSKPTAVRVPTTTKKLPTDPVKLARFKAVELMKMRHQATPGDSRDKTKPVPLEERLHVTAIADRANSSQAEVLWFRKVRVTLLLNRIPLAEICVEHHRRQSSGSLSNSFTIIGVCAYTMIFYFLSSERLSVDVAHVAEIS